jgi:FlaG protein
MEIRGIITPPSPAAAQPARPVTDSLRVPAHNEPVEPTSDTQIRTATPADGKKLIPLVTPAKLELEVDQATQQVYAKVLDSSTGNILRELPSERLRALHAFGMKTLKPTVDTKA